jgi:hypothetical protein
MHVHFTLPGPRRTSRFLLTIVGTLVALSLSLQAVRHYTGHANLLGVVELFDVDDEANIPSYYSALALMAAALILGAITVAKRRAKDPFSLQWGLLAGLFFAMSVDEAAVIHELSIEPLVIAFGLDGALKYAWVIPGGIFAAGFGALMVRFLAHLPRRTAIAFVGAGLVFLGGSLGVEVASASWATAHGEDNFAYNAIITIEEAMEMLGIVGFIAALLDYAERELAMTTVSFDAHDAQRERGSSPAASGQVLREGATRPVLKRIQ